MKKSLIIILCFIICFGLCACGGETIVWDNIILGDKLPAPPADKGENHINAADDLWIDIHNMLMLARKKGLP